MTTNQNITYNNMEIQNSQKGYDSTMAPFFRGHVDENTDEITCDSIIPDTKIVNIDSINNFIKLCKNKLIQDFYINNNGVDREIYIKEWTFFSIDKILSLDEMYKSSNINNIIDLGYIYHGMGWVVVAFYYIPDENIYFRMDGGSNGWDRMDNFNKLKNIDTIIENHIKNNNIDSVKFDNFLIKIENNIGILNDVLE